MATKNKPKQEPRASYTFPWLHRDVSKAVSVEIGSTWFNNKGTKKDANNEYSTKVMGTFRCDNDGCSTHGWGSKTVAILIRGYPDNGYHAVVFNQRCRSCNKLGTLTLDKNSYVERVAYRLKKWGGVRMEVQHYTGQVGPPHERELCEGCKRGHCQQRSNREV